jgi:hypothetical protein
MHLWRSSFEEAPTPSDEQGIAREDSSFIAILEEETYTILRMTRRMQRLHLYALANRERRIVRRGIRDVHAILAADDRQRVRLQDVRVAAGVVMMVVRVYDAGELDVAALRLLLQYG